MIRGPCIIPFITAGDPDLESTLQFMQAMAPHVGAIELGIPFSDPMADGPTIQKANVRALASGTTIDGIFDLVKSFKETYSTPVVLMTYFNPVYHRGIESFVSSAAKSGVDALIIVDLPPEESSEYRAVCQKYGMKTVFLAAPNTTDERLRELDAASTGYLYLVSRYGTTGASKNLPTDICERVGHVKGLCTAPVAVGFGVSAPEHAQQLAACGAEGIIVGSALVRIIEAEGANAAGSISAMIRSMEKAIE